MAQPLALLIDDGIIDEVYTRLKSGKEADIYLVRHAGEVVAAKVYKERNARNFKNNSAYKEGRRVRNTRTQRAMDKGSRFGQASSEAAWKAKESEALHKLHAAGVRVPKPVMFYEGVLLMETILDANGRPAPRLIEAEIPREKAAEWYADVRSQVVKMLACDLVHGDLSPYNVLLAWNGPTVIDFPQVVGAAHNSQAERFFERDLDTIQRFFASHDPALSAHAGDSREIWRAFVRRELTPDFVPTGKGAPGPAKERRPERQKRQGQPQQPGQRPHQQPKRAPQQQPQQAGQRPQQQHPPQRAPQQQPQRQGQQPQRPGQQPQRPGQQPQRQGQQPQRQGQQPRKGSADPQVTLIQRIFGSTIGKPKHGGGHGGGRGHTHRKPHR
jgi:RIO kinase 1